MSTAAIRPTGTEPRFLTFTQPEQHSFWSQVEDGLHAATVHLGHPTSGPIVQLFAAAPGLRRDIYGPHSHASDNFRISIRGVQPVGPYLYEEGDFRFQEGWKGYTGDNVCLGEHGGWQLMVFTDKRGLRVRDVKPNTDPDWGSYIAQMAEMMGIEQGDLFLDDRFDEPGPAGLVSTLERQQPNHGHINGSFAEADGWCDSGAGHKVAMAVMSNPVHGPALVLIRTDPGAVSTPSFQAGADMLRAVIDGDGRVGDRSITVGDMVMWPKGACSEEVVAGDDGLCELVVFGDRRGLGCLEDTNGGWLRFAAKELLPRLEREPVRP